MPDRLRITAMTYGPHGLGRLGGKVVFVRGVAPGEEVMVEIRERHESFDYADVREWIQSVPERREPPCDYLPRCGGCPWQHLIYAAQLEAKAVNLGDALRRIAGLPALKPLPILAAPQELGYRNRLTLRVDGGEIGFYAGGSHELVAVDHCLLASQDLAAGIPVVAELVRGLGGAVRRVEIASRGFAPGLSVSAEVEGSLADGDDCVVRDFLARSPVVAGVRLAGKRWSQVWGDGRIAVRPEPEIELITHAGSFTQVHEAANQLLVRQVLELGELGPEDTVLDLYAGAGNLTLPIARRVRRVVAVEQDIGAAADARGNAERLGLTNVEMIAESARKALARQVETGRYFDLVVLDPPRSGAAEALDSLLRLSPRKLIYVSCNPATLARDLKRLSRQYRVEVVQPIDLFPQTYHLEVVVRATRR